METDISNMVKSALIEASTSFRNDQMAAYRHALQKEENERARWVLEIMMENARLAQQHNVPLCDDTGVPHILVEVGPNTALPPNFLEEIKSGVREGLLKLPGRPMAVRGDAIQRIEQSEGLYNDPGKLVPPGFLMDNMDSEGIKIHVLMLGGGPEIRALTKSVFHKRDHRKLFKEVITWMRSEIPKLGCTPVIPTVGIGRTHFEASSLMLKAMAYGNLNKQSKIEEKITESLNNSKIGPLGIGGSVTALGSFVNIGPQRASGVRILCVRPCCCVEPRRSSVFIPSEILE